MYYHKISFFMYLWQDPSLRQTLLLLAGSILAALMVTAFMISMNTGMIDEIADAEFEEAPVRTYAFSKQGEVVVYRDRALILRNGTCVSSPFTEIWSVGWNDDRNDRILHIRHMSDAGPVTESVHCGPVDIFEAMKVRDMLLHYMGG